MKLTTATLTTRPNSRAADMEIAKASLVLPHPPTDHRTAKPPSTFQFSSSTHFLAILSRYWWRSTLRKEGKPILGCVCSALPHTPAQHWPLEHMHTGHHQGHDIHSDNLPSPNGYVCSSYLGAWNIRAPKTGLPPADISDPHGPALQSSHRAAAIRS